MLVIGQQVADVHDAVCTVGHITPGGASLDRIFFIVESVSYHVFIIGFKCHFLKRHI